MADGVIDTSGSWYVGYQSFGDGCIFIGCTFQGGFSFGKGCVFINCTFYSHVDLGGASHIGPDAVLEGCGFYRNRSDPKHSVADNAVDVGTTEFSAYHSDVVDWGTRVAQNPRHQEGGPIHYDGTKGGQAADNKTDNNWCAVECSPAHVGTVVTGKGGATVVDNGQTTQINGGAGGSGGGSGGSGGSGGGNGMPSNPPDDEVRP